MPPKVPTIRGQPSLLDKWAPPAPTGAVTETIDSTVVWRRCAPKNEDEQRSAVLHYKSKAMQPFRDALADGMELTSVEISLLCPMSKTRIQVPARGADCRHVECFDLDTFIRKATSDKARRDPSGDCPYANCRSKPTGSSLQIDWWLYHVLIDSSLGSVKKIVVTPDGAVLPAPDRTEAMEAIVVDGLSQMPTQMQFAPVTRVKTEPGLSESSPASRSRDQGSVQRWSNPAPADGTSLLVSPPRLPAVSVPSPPEEEDVEMPRINSAIVVNWHLPSDVNDLPSLTARPSAAANFAPDGNGTQSLQRDGSGGNSSPCGPLLGVPYCCVCGREFGDSTVFFSQLSTTRPSPFEDVTCCGVTTAVRSAPHRYREDATPPQHGSMFTITQLPDQGTTIAAVDPGWLGRLTATDLAGINSGLCQGGVFIMTGASSWVCEETLSKSEQQYVAAVLRDGAMGQFTVDESRRKGPWVPYRSGGMTQGGGGGNGSPAVAALSRRRDLIPPRFLPPR